MNVEPAHIHRLYKNKNLINILKYCLIRGGMKGIISRELIQDVLKILQDMLLNQHFKTELLEFYQRYLLDLLLCEKFNSFPIKDHQSNQSEDRVGVREGIVYEDVADALFSLYSDQYQAKDRIIS